MKPQMVQFGAERPQPPLKFVKAADIEPRELRFLWKPYIPRGAVTLLFGKGGLGKSWITCSLAADLSAGRPLPGEKGSGGPQKVLILNGEDDPSYILKPRLQSLGANMEHVWLSDDMFTLNRDSVGRIAEAIDQLGANVFILDPFVAYAGGDADFNQSNQVRAIMAPLRMIAAEREIAVLVVHHARKDESGDAQDTAMGSADFANGVRSQLKVRATPEGQTYLMHSKANWTAKGPPLLYSVDPELGRFQWGGTYGGYVEGTPTVRPRGHARTFLMEALKEGRVPAMVLLKRAQEIGINESTLNRAKRGLVVSKQEKGVWYWILAEGVSRGGVASVGGDPGDRVADGEAGGGGRAELGAGGPLQEAAGGGVADGEEAVVPGPGAAGASGDLGPLELAQRLLAERGLRR